MIDFEAIEFFFAKEKTHIFPYPLKTGEKQPLTQAPRTIKVEYKKPIPLPSPPSPVSLPKVAPTQTPSSPLPSRSLDKNEEKKDNFYSEWEKKYRSLQAGNLLAKEPFKKLALFVIDKKTSKGFAEKIFGAVNTRLMKSIFIITDGPLDELIEKHKPTHIITTKSVTNHIPLPGILIDDLNKIEKSAEKKKELWDKLKTSLKG